MQSTEHDVRCIPYVAGLFITSSCNCLSLWASPLPVATMTLLVWLPPMGCIFYACAAKKAVRRLGSLRSQPAAATGLGGPCASASAGSGAPSSSTPHGLHIRTGQRASRLDRVLGPR